MKLVKAKRISDRTYSESVATSKKGSLYQMTIKKKDKVYHSKHGIGTVKEVVLPSKVEVDFVLAGIRVVKKEDLDKMDSIRVLDNEDIPTDIQNSLVLVKKDITQVVKRGIEYEVSLDERNLSASVFRKLLQNKNFSGLSIRNGIPVLIFIT